MKSIKMIFILTLIILSSCAPSGESGNNETNFASTSIDSSGLALAVAPQNDVDCVLGDRIVPHATTVTAFQNSTVSFGQACVSEIRTCVVGELSGSFNFTSCKVDAAASCLFNGITIKDGESITGYKSSTVTTGQTCDSVAETRICTNGVLSGAAVYDSCQLNIPRACLFNGSTVPHGSFVVAFENSSSQFGQSCSQQERHCNDGTLSGSFMYATCTLDQPASCLFEGRTVAHGESLTAFQSSSSQFGSACISESRICQNGSLSGSFSFASCSMNQPLSCSFNNETVAHGASVIAFNSSSVTFGNQCASETRSCVNGILSGSMNEKNCVVDNPVNCTLNNKTISHGSAIKTYASESVAFGQVCVSQDRSCVNGNLSGAYINETCIVRPPDIVIDPVTPLNCTFNNSTVIHQSKVTAFQAATVPYGSICKSESRLCDDGFLSGNYTYSTCDIEQPKSCLLNGKNIAHSGSVTVFKTSTVPFGQTCQSEIRTCDNGVLSGQSTSESCVIQNPPPPPPPPTGGETCENSNLIWEFPADCKGHCGNGVGYFKSRISRDNGKTWLVMQKNKLPQELNEIWNYLIKQNGKDQCHRPKLNYVPSKNKGYVVLPVTKIPDCKICKYTEVEEINERHGSCRKKDNNEKKKVLKFLCGEIDKKEKKNHDEHDTGDPKKDHH